MEAKRKNSFIERFKPQFNGPCLVYSLMLGTGIFLTTFFVLKEKGLSISENYEFQVMPSSSNISLEHPYILKFSEKFRKIITIEKEEHRKFKQYSWKPKDDKYNMDDAFIKYREWDNGNNDLTLKTKDLYKENVDFIKIKINSKYKNTKNKLEKNIYLYKINEKKYYDFAWQKSAKIINLDEKPIIETNKDVLEYFPNSNDIFSLKDGDDWENYNIKFGYIVQYTGKINGETVDFDLFFQYNEKNKLKEYNFEYKVNKPLSYKTSKEIKKINNDVLNFL